LNKEIENAWPLALIKGDVFSLPQITLISGYKLCVIEIEYLSRANDETVGASGQCGTCIG